MIGSNTNISEVENFMYTLLYENVSKNIFLGGAPTNVMTDWTDFLVVECGAIYEKDAYGQCIVNVLMYPSKNNMNGTKNIRVLNNLHISLEREIKKNRNDSYSLTNVGEFTDYDTQRKLYYNVAIIRLTKL